MTTQPVVAHDHVHQLAEGPVWDAIRRRLLWVDILAGEVHQGSLDGSEIHTTASHRVGEMVGTVAVGDDGELLVAAQEQLALLGPDGRQAPIVRVVPEDAGRRLNDGGVDPAGRFLVGTLSLDGGSDHEELVRLEGDGSLTRIDDDLTLSNGLAWSADGTTMFSVDTLRQVIYQRPYDPATGAIGQRSVHLRVEDGHPDGMAIDAEAHLWIAIWGAGEVRRYAPDGAVDDRVRLPAPHTSSVAFADDDLRTLVITTATAELSDDQRRAHPLSGLLFTARTEVPGLPVPNWKRGAEPATPIRTERRT